ncbi:MAG TPA: cupredoxin domain-containing protein [Herpetosiphonaceae bacterium]|jgi:LPXTG-motif cell wall-anchored protein|nr:cupredoxin domain-containing protein [Herpetosiphonaceae bacterium]
MSYRWITRFAVVAVLLSTALIAAKFAGVAIAAPARASTEVEVDDNYFKPKTLTVQVGTTVKWGNEGKHEHTVTADNGAFGSGDLESGDNFSFTFNKAGTYAYHCKYHGAAGGIGMSGTVIVMAASTSANPTTLPSTGTSDLPAIALVVLTLLLAGLGLVLRRSSVAR